MMPIPKAMHANSHGVGQVIKHAHAQGCKKILLGVGGSAFTDLGIGCMKELGLSTG